MADGGAGTAASAVMAPQGAPRTPQGAIGRREPATLAGLSPAAEAYARDAFARNTRRAYAADLAHFCDWCAARQDGGGGGRDAVETRPLHPDGVRRILRRCAAAAGLVGTADEPISPHGLRAGFVTQACKAGVGDAAIMARTRHKDLRTMRGYVRRARLVEDSLARKLGL